jgi:hypothetical protein
MTSGRRHPTQTLASQTQKRRSLLRNLGRARAGGPLDRLPRPAPETHRSPAGPPDTEPYLPEYAGSTSSPKDTPWARCGAGCVPGDSRGRRLRGAGTSRAPMRRRSPRPATMLRQVPIDPGTPGRWRLIERALPGARRFQPRRLPGARRFQPRLPTLRAHRGRDRSVGAIR